MKALFTVRFIKDYKRLPKRMQEAFDKQLRLMMENPDHPSLDLKKMRDPRDIWRGKLSAGYRFTYQIENDAYLFRRIGPHDVEKNP